MSSRRSGLYSRRRCVFNGFGHFKDDWDPGERRGGGSRVAAPFHFAMGGEETGRHNDRSSGGHSWLGGGFGNGQRWEKLGARPGPRFSLDWLPRAGPKRLDSGP
jgi:hypothetical protein